MRRHLTYANVMSTAGVFLALAGGYAIAEIGGDGSVQSGQVSNLTEKYKTILTVPGMGKVQAACVNTDETRIAWRTGPKPVRVAVERDDESFSFQSNPGARSAYEVGLSGLGATLEFHVFPRLGQDSPQTVVNGVANGFSGDCAEWVAAEAVTAK